MNLHVLQNPDKPNSRNPLINEKKKSYLIKYNDNVIKIIKNVSSEIHLQHHKVFSIKVNKKIVNNYNEWIKKVLYNIIRDNNID